MESLVHDVRYAVRSLTRSAASTTLVVATLALAIGSSAVIFTVIDTLLQSLPARDRSRVVYLLSTDPQRGRERTGTSAPDFLDWKDQTRSFAALGALTFSTFNLVGIDTPIRLSAIEASADLFAVLGIEPALGRVFRPDEDHPRAARVALVTNRFWRQRFAANPAVLGQTLNLNGERYTVVGVLPSRLDAGALRRTDVWVPLALDARSPRDRRSLAVFGLVKPGVTREQSAAEMASIARRLQETYPSTNTGIGIAVLPAVEGFGGGAVRFILGLLMLMAASLVAIACANVANVILARATGRRRELAVRTAMGASRRRLIRQLMVENAVLSMASGVVGLFFCTWEVDAVKRIAGSEMAIFSDMTVGWRVLLFALSVSLIAPLLFGIVPALRAAALDVPEGLKEGAGHHTASPRGQRVRGILVACQTALTFALLIEVALLVRTVLALKNVEKGFDTRNVLTLRIDLPQPKYADARGSARFFDELTSRLEQIPGIEAAAATSRLPIADREVPVRFSIEGRPPSTPEAQQWAAVASVTAGYLRTMRIPLLRGRDLDRIDSAAAAPTVLISRLAASRYWPQENPIGKRIRLENGNDREWSEIVGVVGDVRNSDPGEAPVPQIYVPHSRRSEREMAVVMRTSGDRAALVAAIRAEVLRLDRDQPIYDVATIERLLFDGMAGTYVLAAMMVALAVIALAVAAAGMYGVIAYAVAQRTHEIGIRMALGAEAAAVRRMVMVHGLTPVVIGAGIGLGLGLALVRITAAALHEVKPADPAAYVGVTAVLASVALLASYVPAHRATRIDPLAALRVE